MCPQNLRASAHISTTRGNMEQKSKLFEKQMYAYIVEQTDSSIDKPEGWGNRYNFMADLVIDVAQTISRGKVDFLLEIMLFIETLTNKVVTSKEDF